MESTSSNAGDACVTCKIIESRDAGVEPLWNRIHRTQSWDVAHAMACSLPGWMILIAREHVEAVAQLPDKATTELGPLLREISSALHDVVGCEKTYVMQFAEAPGHHHVHFHIVPRATDVAEEDLGASVFRHLGVSDDLRVPEERLNEIADGMRDRLAVTQGDR